MDNRSTKAQSQKTKRSGNKKQAKPACLNFLSKTHAAVKKHFLSATDLPEFIESAGELDLADRKLLVNQALLILSDNFVHLPLKKSMHGVDPIQKLRLIKHRLEQASTQTMGSEFELHREMIEVFNSVRDLHTNYLLPAPFADKVAFLPFNIEEYYDNGKPHYIAAHFMQGFSHPHFKSGVEVNMWNGVPIKRAISISASRHAGSNMEAQHVRGIDGLTIRALRRSLPPDEMWVIIGYTDANGVQREMRQDWIVSPDLPDSTAMNTAVINTRATSQGVDIEADIIQRTRKMLFAPKVIAAERKSNRVKALQTVAADTLPTTMPGVLAARSVQTTFGEFAYIRLYTFNVDNPDAFIDEFIRLAELLPQSGLIVDVRGNGGGHIFASEGLLQVLTPGEITPEPSQFINTSLNLRLCKRHETNPTGEIDLGPWVNSISRSVETGAIYSRGFPITPTEYANSRGQKYHGPVVLVTDARCYSATDIFAAGFKDHDIGHILGVDNNTGAGGANVWTHSLLRALMQVPAPADASVPYKILPNGADMRVAIRRTMRVGEQSGTPLEDLGVKPDSRHYMTRDDVLDGNKDLIDHAGEILSTMPGRLLYAEVSQSGLSVELSVSTSGLQRLDIYINARPIQSNDIEDGEHDFNIQVSTDADLLELAGYEGGEYVASRKIPLHV